jgi:hypothetical protein
MSRSGTASHYFPCEEYWCGGTSEIMVHLRLGWAWQGGSSPASMQCTDGPDSDHRMSGSGGAKQTLRLDVRLGYLPLWTLARTAHDGLERERSILSRKPACARCVHREIKENPNLPGERSQVELRVAYWRIAAVSVDAPWADPASRRQTRVWWSCARCVWSIDSLDRAQYGAPASDFCQRS